MEHQAIERIARRYRDEGYHVVLHPSADILPPFLDGFQPDMLLTRGTETVVVDIKLTRADLSSDPRLTHVAQMINSQPGWSLDVVILEQETPLERATHDAEEPSDEQLFQILKTADEMTENGYTPYACIIAWSGLEAAMRRLRHHAERIGKTTPDDLMRTLYGNGLLSREQFDRLKESYKIRTQVAHGLVPPPVDPGLVRYVTATARALVSGQA